MHRSVNQRSLLNLDLALKKIRASAGCVPWGLVEHLALATAPLQFSLFVTFFSQSALLACFSSSHFSLFYEH